MTFLDFLAQTMPWKSQLQWSFLVHILRGSKEQVIQRLVFTETKDSFLMNLDFSIMCSTTSFTNWLSKRSFWEARKKSVAKSVSSMIFSSCCTDYNYFLQDFQIGAKFEQVFGKTLFLYYNLIDFFFFFGRRLNSGCAKDQKTDSQGLDWIIDH